MIKNIIFENYDDILQNKLIGEINEKNNTIDLFIEIDNISEFKITDELNLIKILRSQIKQNEN